MTSIHCQIHPSAIVDPKATIAEDVVVGPYSIIGPNVTLDAGVWVGPHVVIEGHTHIGAGTRIFQFASIGSAPQDLKYRGEASTLTLGSNNIVREYVTLQPGTQGGGMATRIGDRNLFMANSHVGHDSLIGNDNIFANSVALAGHVTITSGVIIGGLAAVHQFVKIGENALLSGGAMVSQDVPPYCIAQGDRATLRGINTIGLQRHKFSPEDISAVKKAYRHMFFTTGKLKEKAENLPTSLLASSAVMHFIEFITSSERGICSSAKQ